MKFAYSALITLSYFTFTFCADPLTCQQLSELSKHAEANKLHYKLLEWHYASSELKDKACLGYIHNLSCQLRQPQLVGGSTHQKDIAPALALIALLDVSQLDEKIKNQTLTDADTLYVHASDEVKQQFIAALSPEVCVMLPETLDPLNTGHQLIVDICKARIKNEERFDLFARLQCAQSLIKNSEAFPITEQDMHAAHSRLCEVLVHCNKETQYDLNARRDAWLLRTLLAYISEDYEESIDYCFRSLFEQYNIDVKRNEHRFPEHIPFEINTIVCLMRDHPYCRTKVEELLNDRMKPEVKQWFLGELFRIAWEEHHLPDGALLFAEHEQQHGHLAFAEHIILELDKYKMEPEYRQHFFQTAWKEYGLLKGGWLLAQHEQKHGNLEGARDILQELNKQNYPQAVTELEKVEKQLQLHTFNTLWEQQICVPSEENKTRLDEFVAHLIDNEEHRDYVLKLCKKQDQKEYIWNGVFKKAQDPANKMEPQYQQHLFQTAWKEYGLLEGGWLLAQHEQKYGDLQGARDILQELNKQNYAQAKAELEKVEKQLRLHTFNTLWEQQVCSPSEKNKNKLDEFVANFADHEDHRNHVLKACTSKDEKEYIWDSILNKSEGPLKFQAAFQLAQLTDDTKKKIIFLGLALTNGIQEAAMPAFTACKEVGCNAQTKMLCTALAEHAPEKLHAELVAWLRDFENNDHAIPAIKKLADKKNAYAQLMYGLHCSQHYFARKKLASKNNQPIAAEIKELKQQAENYLDGVLQHPEEHQKQRQEAGCELAYLKMDSDDFSGAQMAVHDGAEDGHLRSQKDLAYYYYKEALHHAQQTQMPPQPSAEADDPILNAQKQAVYWYEKPLLNADCPEARIDIYHHSARVHLDLADMYETKSHNAKTKPLKEAWHKLSQKTLDLAKEKLELILGFDKKNVCALRSLGLIHEQCGERERAIELLLEAYSSDPTSQKPLGDLMSICSRYGIEFEQIKRKQLKALLNAKNRARDIVAAFVNRPISWEANASCTAHTLANCIAHKFDQQGKKIVELLKSTELPDSLIDDVMKEYTKATQRAIEEAVAPLVDEFCPEDEPEAEAQKARVCLKALPEEDVKRLLEACKEAIDEEVEAKSQATEVTKKEEEVALNLIEKNAKCSDAWNILGICANRNNKVSQAAEHFKKAIEYGSVEAMTNLANMYFITDDQEALRKAEELYVQALAVDPSIADAQNNLGITRSKLGKDKEAVQSYKENAKRGSIDARIHTAECKMAGYGGYYNLEEAMFEFLGIAEATRNSNSTAIADEVDLLRKLAQYEVINYLEKNAELGITEFFPLIKSIITEKQLNASQQSILEWSKKNQKLRTFLIKKASDLLQKAKDQKSKPKKINLYNQARKAFQEACTDELRLDILERAETELQKRKASVNESIKAEIELACGQLHFYQGHYFRELEQHERTFKREKEALRYRKMAEEQCKLALEYVKEAASNQDIGNPHTPRRMYYYAVGLIEHYLVELKPLATLTEPQKKFLEKSISLLKDITDTTGDPDLIDKIAKAQPHHYFVGEAHSYLGDIKMAIYENPEAARAHYQAGAGIGHAQCYLRLAQGYERGAWTDDDEFNKAEAKRLLEESLDKCNPKDHKYPELKKALKRVNRVLDPDSSSPQEGKPKALLEALRKKSSRKPILILY